jgi:sarcosine oxidase subunit gamma
VDNQLHIRTALSEFKSVEGDHRLSEAPLNGKINLRGNKDNPEFVRGIENLLGLSLPLEANTVSSSFEQLIFWLGPDEWLIHLPLNELEKTIRALRETFVDQHVALTDVSDYFSVLHLSGPQAREVIASASPFDTRTHHFKPDLCAQTCFGHASILLWPLDDVSTFGLQVRWSYAQYVYDYLTQSIRNTENLTKLNAFL